MINTDDAIPPRPSRWPVLALVAIAVIVTAEISRSFTFNDLPMSAVWPPAGIIVATALALGPRSLAVPVLALGLWMAASQQAPLIAVLLTVCGQAAGAFLAYQLMQRYWRRPQRRRPLATQLGMYLNAVVAGAAVTALVGSIGYAMAMPGLPDVSFVDLWVVYWVFEAMGILLFTPLAYMLLKAPERFFQQMQKDWQRRELRLWLALIVILLLLVALHRGQSDSEYVAAIGFAFFPALCWFVLQGRAAGVVLAIPLFAALFVGLSLLGWVGLPSINSVPELIRSLLLVGGLAALAQMIAAITAERTLLLRDSQNQAVSDYLTGLANDRGLAGHLRELLEADHAHNHWLVRVEVLDIEQIEELLGYEDSLHLERLLAALLIGALSPRTQPARIGPGTFVFVLEAATREQLEEELYRIDSTLNHEQVSVGDHQLRIRSSIGAIALDGSLKDHNHYLSAVTQANLRAKDQIRRVLIMEENASLIRQRQAMTEQLEQLKGALVDDRLALFAQPIRHLSHPETALSFEILLRLRTPEGELLGPGEFLPVAETFGYMLEIDRWVIAHTLKHLTTEPQWAERIHKCSINLAGASLSSPELIPFISEALTDSGFPPHKLSFEITETERIEDRDQAKAILDGLRALGCSVSLDDFGTGLASFDYLRSFALDYVKIDGLFVRDLVNNPTDQSMVKAICAVCQSMNLTTIAEFVEGEEVIGLLRQLGVDYGQGFGLGRPQPLTDLFPPRPD